MQKYQNLGSFQGLVLEKNPTGENIRGLSFRSRVLWDIMG